MVHWASREVKPRCSTPRSFGQLDVELGLLRFVQSIAEAYVTCMIDLTDAQYEGLVRLQDGRPVVFEKLKRLVSF